MQGTSRNIGLKAVDISLLQLSETPSDVYQQMGMELGSNQASPGLQKLANRFVMVLFTPLGAVKHDPDFGTTLLQNLSIGSSLNFGAVQTEVALAILQAERQLKQEDELVDSPYSDVPDPDEQLESAVCTDVSYEPRGGILRLYVSLTNKAGESYTYILPANLETLF